VVQLSSRSQLLEALATAQRIDVQAYTLTGKVLSAVEAAAGRGAIVTVQIEGQPHADPGGRLAERNARLAAQLQNAGADVRLQAHAHAKIIDADDERYFDDQNWGKNDLILRDDDPSDAAAIPAMKDKALKAEADMLRAAPTGDVVETESFGGYNPVFWALHAIADRKPRLLVNERDLRGNPRERTALDRLAAEGVCIRVCRDTEKFALTAQAAWIGSANASPAFDQANMTDWGLVTTDPGIVAAVRARVESQWANARNYRPNSA
jgi:hypothetical protein